MAEVHTRQFRAETRKVLNILTHSLYTNREIFLRELLSNASDALEKVRFMQSKGESVRDADLPLEIRITLDRENKTLSVADTGVGMTEEEMIENLGTIAKSGSEQFLKDREKDAPHPKGPAEHTEEADKPEPNAEATDAGEEDRLAPDDAPRSDASQIIGHFGIGFYSVFMVADKVEVTSVSATGDGSAHVWTSDGQRRLYHPPTFRRRSERPQARHRGPGAPQGRRRRLSGKIPHRVSDPAAFQLPALPHSD